LQNVGNLLLERSVQDAFGDEALDTPIGRVEIG
jgi:hypothetical protein